ncbi:hypothetical protein ATE71_07530 [Sphingopyxis sp. H115]|nr:hypothetical protein ATE71_07530 [Sphingopyxis sp. H115]
MIDFYRETRRIEADSVTGRDERGAGARGVARTKISSRPTINCERWLIVNFNSYVQKRIYLALTT